jgi:hypothetical protein
MLHLPLPATIGRAVPLAVFLEFKQSSCHVTQDQQHKLPLAQFDVPEPSSYMSKDRSQRNVLQFARSIHSLGPHLHLPQSHSSLDGEH